MKFIAINGSPRKNGSTAQLLEAAAKGARDAANVSARVVDLIDYNACGCLSCYGCKQSPPGPKGLCVVDDKLSEVYTAIDGDTVLVLASPIYNSYITGLLKNFIERLTFPLHTRGVTKPAQIPVAMIFTMSQTEINYYRRKYDRILEQVVMQLERYYGKCTVMNVFDTFHFTDYSTTRIEASTEKLERKVQNYRDVFPRELERAYVLGRELVERAQFEAGGSRQLE